MKKKALLLFVVILGLTGMPSLAAVPEKNNPLPAELQQTVENREYKKLEKETQEEKKQDESNVTDQTAKQEPATPDTKTQIFVKKIMMDPSAILSDAEISSVTGKYEGRSVTIQDLYQALKEINTLYAEKGFITAKAILPPQKVEDGVVRIKLVEAHFGQLLLEGNEHTRGAYIFKRLSQKDGDLVNIKTLEQDIFYFNRTNDVQIKAELKPGKEFGQTDCVLKVEEPDNIQGTLFSDNEGSKNTGEYRLGLSFVDNSLTGHRDFFTVSPLWSEGTMAGSISYNLPITRKGTRLGVTYSENLSDVISGKFENMEITSDETDIGLNLSHPLRVKPNFKLDGFASLFTKKASTDFSDITLIDYCVDTISLGFSVQTVDSVGFWYSRYEITCGEADYEGDPDASQKPDDFYRFNFAMIRQRKLKEDRSLTYRFTSQLSADKQLPSTETFSLGGINTIRGCSAGLLTGDQGYNFSIEYNFPFRFTDKAKGFYFLDHGGTFPYKGNNESTSDEDFLTSLGIGANFTYSKHFSGKIILGVPLNPPDDEDGFRLEFYLQSMIF